MGVGISYMGTKKELAPAVGKVIEQCQKGILLDAFAGMCSVGEEVAPQRQIWSNDTQVFAAEIAKALFTSFDEPPAAIRVADIHFDDFARHRAQLLKSCKASDKAESILLTSPNFEAFERRACALKTMLLGDLPSLKTKNCNLFTKTYSDNYFGVRQAIEADSIVKAICESHKHGTTTTDQKRWLVIALGRALLKVANSTGHFAQYLKPKQSSYRRFLTQRRRDLWAEWLFSIGELNAVGAIDWRLKNKVFNQDSLVLLPALKRRKERPAVVYADPPYTDDQYSRYYHLLDTLVLYDFPEVSGAGLYRSGRFSTSFSHKSEAILSFETLVRSCAAIGADLVLSYPTNGLLYEVGVDPKNLLAKHYRKVECCCELAHRHSSFGASKGTAQYAATELIYLARS
jgi:adenine-specific DNA-methyltransferase